MCDCARVHCDETVPLKSYEHQERSHARQTHPDEASVREHGAQLLHPAYVQVGVLGIMKQLEMAPEEAGDGRAVELS